MYSANLSATLTIQKQDISSAASQMICLISAELAHHGPEDLFIAVMTFLGAFWIMLTINVKLALVAVLFVPLLIILITYLNIRMTGSAPDVQRNRRC